MVNSESTVGVKPGDSGEVIGYQVDEFTCTWSAEWFVAHSHIYTGFTGKVSSLTHFPLEPGYESYSFLGQAVANFKQNLDSILGDSIKTPELDMWISLMSLHPQYLLAFPAQLALLLILLNYSLLLASGPINFGARIGPFFHMCLWLPICQHLN